MKNGDFIRSLDDDRLGRFLWTWSINSISSFLQFGGTKLKNARELRDWIQGDEFPCEETLVQDDMIFDQQFNLKVENENK